MHPRSVRSALGAFLLLASTTSIAQQIAPPLPGVYWNPNQSGRGWSVDVQDNFVFILGYNYSNDSEPTFFVVQGLWDGFGRRVANAQLFQVPSGPCFTCPYTPPASAVSAGPISFEFPFRDRARITFQGQVTELVPFLYNFDPTSTASNQRGVWFTTQGDFGVWDGEAMNVTGACSTCDPVALPNAFQGTRLGSTRVLVGAPLNNGAGPQILLLLDSSTSFYRYFLYVSAVNNWFGEYWLELKSAPTPVPGTGDFMAGNRLVGGTYASLFGAATAGKALSDDEREAADWAQYRRMQARGKTATGQVAADLTGLSSPDAEATRRAWIGLRGSLGEQ